MDAMDAMDAIRLRLRVFLAVLFVVLLTGTVGFMVLEGQSLVDALYFTVVTVATVGYGDIHPTTVAGKVVAMVIIAIGVGTFLGVVANATDLLLARRQEATRRERLHMVVGLFFSELGTTLLRHLCSADPDVQSLEAVSGLGQEWSDDRFREVSREFEEHRYRMDPASVDLPALRQLLTENGGLLLRLLENPNLLSHEAFTELLRAVFHLKEELLHRTGFDELPEPDIRHLAGDAGRVYPLLARQWQHHMEYLRKNYPYLFSLAVRTNPFSENSSVIIR